MTVAARLDSVCRDLVAGRLLAADDAALVARAVRRLLAADDGAGFVAAESRRTRDEALRRLASEHLACVPSTRGRALRIAELGRRYELGRWRHDRHRASCPYAAATPDALLWVIFAEGGGMPELRQLQSIIAN